MSLQEKPLPADDSAASLKAALAQRERELAEAHARETATAEVLKAIRSTSDLQKVLDTLLETACRLCEADIGTIRYAEGEGYRLAATFGCRPEWREHFAGYSTKPDRTSVFGQTILNGSTVHVPDVLEDPEYARPVAQKLMGLRAALGVPLMRAGKTFGVISLFRTMPRPFTAKQIALLETFADQAEIAIENARLMSEQREALDRQTATSEVLKVIASSPTDVQPVFDAIAQSALRLFGGQSATVTRVVGDEIHLAALTTGSDEGITAVQSSFPSQLSSSGIHSRVARSGQPAFRFDIENEPDVSASVKELARARGYRSILVVPMLRSGVAIGTIGVTRPEPGTFSDDQIALLRSFADQAVIAIENTRLFAAEQQRTKELTESLEQQTATSEVLKIISASPGELAPVFDAMLTNATEICEAKFGQMLLYEDGNVHIVAQRNAPAELAAWDDKMGRHPPVPGGPLERLIGSKEDMVHIPDVTVENSAAPAARLGGAKTLLVVAMRKDDALIGAIIIYRQEVRPFSEKQIELVSNFAAQAVIAIENARLLNELRESLEQQTATSEVLRVISASPGDVEPVFSTILENATSICSAHFGNLFLHDDDGFRAVAMYNAPPGYAEIREGQAFNPAPDTGLGRMVVTKRVFHIADLRDTEGYKRRDAFAVGGVERGGIRTLLAVPMLKDGNLAGAIVIYRQEVKPFTDKQIALVQNFAAQAVIAIENARLLGELRESLERQTATSEVLRVISSSPGAVKPVFDSILANATRICEAEFGTLMLCEGDGLRAVALHGGRAAYAEQRQREPVIRPSPNVPVRRALNTRQVQHVADLRTEPAYIERDTAIVTMVEAAGARTFLAVPMLKDNEAVGAIVIYRQEVRPFADKQIELVQNFAAQAVIAIENARLLSELRESLDQQTATSQVLEVISASPGDLKPVFEAMLENATRICGATFGSLVVYDGEHFRRAAAHNAPATLIEDWKRTDIIDLTQSATLRPMLTEKKPTHILDLAERFPNDPLHRLAGARTFLAVPMLKEGELIGVIGIYRREVAPFSDKQIELVSSFAAQAVIAIENTRLLSELRRRTGDLTETLGQQTATSDILEVISNSPTDTQPAFDAIVRSGLRLFPDAAIVISLPEGDTVHLGAIAVANPGDKVALQSRYPMPLSREYITGTAILDRKEMDIADAQDTPVQLIPGGKNFLASGYRAITVMPMMRGEATIGALSVARREPGALSDKQKELLRTFASQAVIAIENTRLFNELRELTDDLSESLQQQTATADVLKVISRSTFDLQTVLNTLTESASRLCGADKGVISLLEGDAYVVRANYGFSAEAIRWALEHPLRPGRDSMTGRVALEGKAIHIPDVLADPEYKAIGHQQAFGYRTNLGVPLLREGTTIGVFALTRDQVNPFTDKQIALATTFADQAVIAIENVRLFDEVQARTEDLSESLRQQTATADVLAVMSRSQFDLAPILQSVVDTAARLCRAEKAVIFRLDDGLYRFAAGYSLDPKYIEIEKATPIAPGPGTAVGRAAMDKQVVRIDDAFSDPHYAAKDDAKIGDVRSMIGVPLMREGEAIGVIALARSRVEPFNEREIDLVTTFADQAVIAIENVRLFDEIQDKSRQLEEASKHKSQFLANMSHELRTPLNAILGYTELIADGVYGETPEKVQATIKRVMTNGRHLLGLINDVLDLSKIEAGQLSLSLTDYSMKDVVYAVYGAVEPLAAEKKLNFKAEIMPDMAIGHGDERRLTQVLLNLVGNAIKFTDDGDVIIKASQNNGAFSVAVCDTGPGISEDDQKKLFQEFQQADSSTTKKKGGTGLGLAISKKIIEMHGGRIWLESQVGKGSIFAFTVPARAEQAKRQA